MISSRRCIHLLKFSVYFLVLLIFPSSSRASTLIVPTQHPTIQGALNAALNGDTVLVQPGTYTGISLQFNGKAIHLKSANGPAVTTIRGNLANPVFSLAQGEKRTTIIEGFTITDGARVNGGGMILNGTSPTIRGNIFTKNRATGIGGGGCPVVFLSAAKAGAAPTIPSAMSGFPSPSNSAATIGPPPRLDFGGGTR